MKDVYLDKKGGHICRGNNVYDAADIFTARSFLENRRDSMKILDEPAEYFFDMAVCAVLLVENTISPKKALDWRFFDE